MNTTDIRLYEFGPFRLDVSERVLFRDGAPVLLTPKAADLLIVLVENRGHIVEKKELLERVWPDNFVEEGNLAVTVSMLRKILEKSTGGERYIETVARRGYRFIAPVTKPEVVAEAATSPIEPSPVSSPESAIPDETNTNDGESDAVAVPAVRVLEVTRPRTRGRTVRFWLGTVIATLAISAAWLTFFRPTADPGVKSLAVLPFRSLDAHPDSAALGLGMADALITRLGGLKTVAVRPTSAVLKYADAKRDLSGAGGDLNVDAVLEGHMQRINDRIRVTVQLLRVRDGAPLWSDTFDREFTNIFEVQDRISEQVAETLTVKLSEPERKRLTRRDTWNTEAYQHYVQGRYFWSKRTSDGFEQAERAFQQAITLDPRYAAAYLGLADTHLLRGLYGTETMAKALPKAKTMAQKALEIDDALAEAHASLAMIVLAGDWDPRAAERYFKQSIILNPNYTTAHKWHSCNLVVLGEFDQSVEAMKRACELDPTSPDTLEGLGEMYSMSRRYDEAIKIFDQVLTMDPTLVSARFGRAEMCRLQGRFAEAEAELERIKSFASDDPHVIAAFGEAYGKLGKKAEARGYLDKLLAGSREKYVSPLYLAFVYIGLDDKDTAFQWLDKAVSDHAFGCLFLKRSPFYDSLRSDPRFEELVRRVGV